MATDVAESAVHTSLSGRINADKQQELPCGALRARKLVSGDSSKLTCAECLESLK